MVGIEVIRLRKMASRDQRGGQTHHGSANHEHHIKRRNRNFDPKHDPQVTCQWMVLHQ